MALSKEEILDGIASLTVMEVVELVSAMEEKFGVSAAAPTVVAQASESEAAAVEEKTEFDITLTSFGEKKVQVIKAIRAVTGLGLKEAKSLVESVPSVVKEALPKEECEKIKKTLEEAGGSAEIK